MTKHKLLILSLFGLSPVVMCCTEQTAPTDNPTTRVPIASNFIKGPSSPGKSGLLRYRDFYLEVAVDERAGLISIHGLKNTVAEVCAGQGDIALGDFQVKRHRAGEVNAKVVDRSSPVQILAFPPNPTDLCSDLSGAPVLYSGTVTFRRLDNNLTPTGTEGGRANSYGWTAHGVVDDLVNGGQVHYSETVRFLINPKTGEFRVLVSNIRIN